MSNGRRARFSSPPGGGGGSISVADEGYFLAPSGVNTFISVPVLSAANLVRVMSFVLPFEITVRRIVSNLATASAGGLGGIGIYDASSNKLLADDGFSTTVIGLKLFTLGTPVVLPAPAAYFVAWTFDNTVARFSGATFNTTTFQILDAQAIKKVGDAANASAAGVLPATLGAITSLLTQAASLQLEP